MARNICPPRWKKGESGNPAGKKPGTLATKTILKKFLSIKKNIQNPLTEEFEDMSIAEIMHLKQIANALQGDLASYKEIIDRVEGKSINRIEMDADVTQTTIMVGFSDEIEEEEDETEDEQ